MTKGSNIYHMHKLRNREIITICLIGRKRSLLSNSSRFWVLCFFFFKDSYVLPPFSSGFYGRLCCCSRKCLWRHRISWSRLRESDDLKMSSSSAVFESRLKAVLESAVMEILQLHEEGLALLRLQIRERDAQIGAMRSRVAELQRPGNVTPLQGWGAYCGDRSIR